jgi:hypothetical protein
MSLKSVQTAEWTVAVSFSFLLLALLLISNLHTSSEIAKIGNSRHLFSKEKKFCKIAVSGEVSKPGIYLIEKGMPFHDVLKKCHPKKWADIKNFKSSLVVEKDLTIVIEPLQKIVIRVVGEVENEAVLELAVKTKISDLKGQIACTSKADLTFFKKRRCLQDGEVVTIPQRQEKPVAI